MNSAAYLSAVKEEIARLQQIEALLEGKSTNPNARSSNATTVAKRKGGMSDAGRARVAEAQRLRWAAKKKADAEAAATPDPTPAKKAQAPAKKAAKKLSVSAPKTAAKPGTAKKSAAKKHLPATRPVVAGKSAPGKKKTPAKAAPKKISKDATKLPVANRRSDTAEVEQPLLETADLSTSADATSNE